MRIGLMEDRDERRQDNGARTAAAPAPEVAGKAVLVVGLARTGVAASRFLASRGAVVTATDVKPAGEIGAAGELLGLGVTLDVGHRLADPGGAEILVVSPGVPRDLPLLEEARARGAEVISEVELAWRYMRCPVAAVAGTNGKSTTTELLGTMLAEAGHDVFVGGNIGTPAIEYAGREEPADNCVLEVSSFQLETTTTFRPRVGILLNITEDHLDRYSGFADYAETKFRLFENQGPGDFAVINADDPLISRRALKGLTRGKLVPFTVSGRFTDGVYLDGDRVVWSWDGAEEAYPTAEIALKGLHNMENVMAAVAAARLLGVEREAVARALKTFAGLPHRMETVRELSGVTYINDSKGTNVGSLEMALRGISTPVVLIAGGVDKGGDYSTLAPLVREKVRVLVLIGEAAARIESSLGHAARTVRAESLEEAVRVAGSGAVEGDTVLLCPACASFDMFADYRDRGERFRELVKAL